MKIAVSVKENKVEEHFGHCYSFVIFNVNAENEFEESLVVYSSEGCGCKSNIASLLKEKEVKVLLAGTMGYGAFVKLNNAGIKVYRGCSGDVLQLVKAYIKGDIVDSVQQCNHNHEHTQDQQCSHS